jgi:hypothetical protein
MPNLAEIQAKFSHEGFEFSKHAVDRMIAREISVNEIREAIRNGEIIEDYPDDKYSPSCLIFGTTIKQRPIHLQCGYPTRPIVKVITVYEPDPAEWIEYKKRK